MFKGRYMSGFWCFVNASSLSSDEGNVWKVAEQWKPSQRKIRWDGHIGEVVVEQTAVRGSIQWSE